MGIGAVLRPKSFTRPKQPFSIGFRALIPGFAASRKFRTECSETETGFRNIPMGDHHLGYIQSEIVV